MKKLLALFLALALSVSMAACSQGNESSSSDSQSVSESAISEASESSVSHSSSEASEESVAEESQTAAPETVTIQSLNAEREEVELVVPYDPQRIAILDMASLDILDALGLGDRVVGTAQTSLDYLQEYISEDIANLGTIKEADLEAVMSCEPDVIFIGGRLSSS